MLASKIKKILLIFIILITLISVTIFVTKDKSKTTNITFTLTDMKEEDIKYSPNKFNIYLFWGDGCLHCEDLINYLNTIDNNYKSKFNLYTFEVWYNQENNRLLNKMATKLNTKASGIPFLIVGDKYLIGYIDSMSNEVLNLIIDECNKSTHQDLFLS